MRRFSTEDNLAQAWSEVKDFSGEGDYREALKAIIEERMSGWVDC